MPRKRRDEIVLDDAARSPASSLAGDSVPQNGQTSFCFAGFQIGLAAAGRAGELAEVAAVSSMATEPRMPRAAAQHV